MIRWNGVAAVLLDMDGTLVDSEHVSDRCWAAWCERRGKPLAEVLEASRGRPALEVMRPFAPELTDADFEADLAQFRETELTDTERVEAMPGAARLVRLLGEAKLPYALVTSAGRPLARVRMEAAGLRFPEVAVCGDDIRLGKPAPEGYLRAAELLGAPIGDCVVIEDAPAGVAGGRAAGARVIAVGGTDHASADITVGTLSRITPAPASLRLDQSPR